MNILGISCFYHDSSAAIIVDGQIIAAVQEERFSRVKGDRSFPRFSIAYCLDQASLTIDRIDFVAFYEQPSKSFKRVYSNLHLNPNNILDVYNNILSWGLQRLQFDKYFKNVYPNYTGEFYFSRHHISHAASAFFPSGLKEASILTIDAVGEDTTATISLGSKNQIKLLKIMKYPDSIGLLYSCITTFLGFKANLGEYKVMGLAPYGDSKTYFDIFKQELCYLYEDGSLKLNMKYFDFTSTDIMFTNNLEKLFHIKPRINEYEPINKTHMDIAAGLQAFTDEVVFLMSLHAQKLTNIRNLCLSGGVALNCVSNGNLQRSKKFDKIWVQPASGDSGNALGAALYLYHQVLGNPKTEADNDITDLMQNCRLGPSYSDYEIRCFLDSIGACYEYYKDDTELTSMLVDELMDGHIFGLFRGRMEFGPRALGNRSIIGDPRSQETQTRMNLKIKFRESFRPFAPFVLREHVSEWFQDSDLDNKYMLFVYLLNESKRFNQPIDYSTTVNILQLLNQPRSEVPAVTHVDYSARLQTVSHSDNPFIYNLLSEFNLRTNIPFLVNTSFNVRGEPIVCTPLDAYNCMINTYMDGLCMGNYFLRRSDQTLPEMPPEAIRILRPKID